MEDALEVALSFVRSLSILTKASQRENKDGSAFNLSHTWGERTPILIFHANKQ